MGFQRTFKKVLRAWRITIDTDKTYFVVLYYVSYILGVAINYALSSIVYYIFLSANITNNGGEREQSL